MDAPYQGRTPAFLLAPWPESLLAYEQPWEWLGRHTHLVAVDLPGFGRSECRDDLVSLELMAGFVLRTAEAFGLENPHAVGPGTGTPALLLAAATPPGRELDTGTSDPAGGSGQPDHLRGDGTRLGHHRRGAERRRWPGPHHLPLNSGGCVLPCQPPDRRGDSTPSRRGALRGRTVSPRTVQYHLGKVFAKPCIRSRAQLADALPRNTALARPSGP
ncbi:hypothetical protein [Streptomyces flaveolus]|uniref:hypothetical protein n=1 Tax=Streptomyces flaveolus TaxID=67297 RepID=UPI003F544738